MEEATDRAKLVADLQDLQADGEKTLAGLRDKVAKATGRVATAQRERGVAVAMLLDAEVAAQSRRARLECELRAGAPDELLAELRRDLNLAVDACRNGNTSDPRRVQAAGTRLGELVQALRDLDDRVPLSADPANEMQRIRSRLGVSRRPKLSVRDED
jgi:hypothetical protein